MSLLNRKVSKTFPCKCGHPWNLHDWAGASIGDEFCGGLKKGKRVATYKNLCDCVAYVPDNLKYLEQCLKKRGK